MQVIGYQTQQEQQLKHSAGQDVLHQVMHAWFWNQNCFPWGNLQGSESLLAQFYCLQFFLRLIQLNIKALDVSGSLEPALVFALEMREFECQSTCKCFTGYQLRLVEEMPSFENRFGLCKTASMDDSDLKSYFTIFSLNGVPKWFHAERIVQYWKGVLL